jgi:hypothetical protein
VVVLAASAVAFTIGCSRVFIQVLRHLTCCGFVGQVWLAVCIGSIELTRHYRHNTRFRHDVANLLNRRDAPSRRSATERVMLAVAPAQWKPLTSAALRTLKRTKAERLQRSQLRPSQMIST